jgi:hypothetical protein
MVKALLRGRLQPSVGLVPVNVIVGVTDLAPAADGVSGHAVDVPASGVRLSAYVAVAECRVAHLFRRLHRLAVLVVVAAGRGGWVGEDLRDDARGAPGGRIVRHRRQDLLVGLEARELRNEH